MLKPTKGDFDRATAQDWQSSTCLVAQLMIRQGFSPKPSCGRALDPFNVAEENSLQNIQMEFDANFSSPKDVSNSKLQQLRKSLPYFNWPWQKLKLPA